MIQLKDRMYKQLELLKTVYDEEIISTIINKVSSTHEYSDLLDLIPLVFKFDENIVILKSVNELTGRNNNSSKEVTEYIEKNITNAYYLFNFNLDAVKNHIVLTHLAFSEVYPSNPFKDIKNIDSDELVDMLGMNDNYQMNIIQGSIEDIIKLFIKDDDNDKV